jgi:hypothetical protein
MMGWDPGRSFDALMRGVLETAEPYCVFRARAREALANAGWELGVSDSESDYFSKGRWWIYTSPGDRLSEFDAIYVWEYSTAEEASAWGDGDDLEPLRISQEFAIKDALHHVEEHERRRKRPRKGGNADCDPQRG